MLEGCLNKSVMMIRNIISCEFGHQYIYINREKATYFGHKIGNRFLVWLSTVLNLIMGTTN